MPTNPFDRRTECEGCHEIRYFDELEERDNRMLCENCGSKLEKTKVRVKGKKLANPPTWEEFYRHQELIDLLIETAKNYLWDEGVLDSNLDKAAIVNLRGAIDAINEKYINQI